MTNWIRKTSLCTTVFIILFCAFSFAQPNTLVMGKVKNKNSLINEIELRVNMRYISNNVEVYKSNILEDGTFAFAVEMIQPQYVNLVYSRNKGVVYLEPNDTVYIEFEATSFPLSMSFGGKGGANNTYLYSYFKDNPQEFNEFKMVQYRKGKYWYSNTPYMDKLIRSTHKAPLIEKMLQKKQKAFSKLDLQVKNHPGMLSPDFKEFLSTEIFYDWAYQMLLFGHVFKGQHDVQPSFFNFLDEVPLVNDYIGNYKYREFLLAYLNYRQMETGNETSPYADQYDLASNLLGDKSLAYAQSEMIFRAFLSEHVDEMMSRFWDFIDHTEYLEFEEKVNSAYQKARRYSVGAPAPDFNLKDENEQIVTLNQFGGKVVFLNFWASWCRPCMKKMDKIKPIMQEMEDKGVVFLNVSLDRSESAWKNAIATSQFGGVHVLAPGDINSEIAKLYEIKILPQYYIINQNGSFAERPRKNDISEIRSTLTQLARRN